MFDDRFLYRFLDTFFIWEELISNLLSFQVDFVRPMPLKQNKNFTPTALGEVLNVLVSFCCCVLGRSYALQLKEGFKGPERDKLIDRGTEVIL